MKKIGLLVKEISENKIKSRLKASSAFFIVRYSGLSSPDLSSLRQNLKDTRAEMFVPKNSVARRALKSAGFADLCAKIDGPSGFVFIDDEPVATSRILCGFAKTNERLKLEGGFFGDKILEKQDIEALAKLPAKEVLRAQVVMTLNSPIRNLVVVLNQTLRKFVYCLEQIKNKKAVN